MDVYISYDEEADILWIGRRCECFGARCIHGRGEIVEERGNLFLTINEDQSGRPFISSIALKDASRQAMWGQLFRGMLGVAGKKTVSFGIGAAE